MPNASRILTLIGLTMLIGAMPLTAAGEGHDDVMNSPSEARDLLFIHNSCGGQLFADTGEVVGGVNRDTGEYCIHVSHPNGGGLRTRLEQAGYRVHEASYGSILGEETDLCRWRRKFAENMDRIVHTERQDKLLPEGEANEIVCFKSCYPNNWFSGPGIDPGDPDECERTVANARAAYNALLPLFRQQPGVLFVAFTAPPMAEYKPQGLKATIKSWFTDTDRGGAMAREFNAWLTDRQDGWLAGHDLPNVAVFDYYGVLSEGNAKGYTSYGTRGGRDSHPSSEGNQKAAATFVPFLEAAVAGMDRSTP